MCSRPQESEYPSLYVLQLECLYLVGAANIPTHLAVLPDHISLMFGVLHELHMNLKFYELFMNISVKNMNNA